MYHFFVKSDQIDEEKITITGSDVNHIKNVLRMKEGEGIVVSDGEGNSYLCGVAEMNAEEVICHVFKKQDSDAELPCEITLYQGLPKSDKMEMIVQKCVELGVSHIVPVAMHRCVMKLDPKKADNKIKRWNTIAESAAKQSGRSFIPDVTDQKTFGQVMEEVKNLDVFLVPYEKAENMSETRAVMEQIRPGQRVGILIGPEGGFEPSEVEKAEAAGAKAITLGKRILRTETAGMAILSMLVYLLEDNR